MKEKDLTFEDKLWKAADKLRKKVEVHEYKYVVLGLIFLRYLSFAFEEKRKEIEEKEAKQFSESLRFSICEDRDFYIANGTLYVPEKARWDYIVKNANQPNIGEIIDQAIEILEKEYPKQLENVIPKIYSQVNLDSHDFAYLINLFSQIHFGKDHHAKDIFGRIYEYFLSKFTEAEGKRGWRVLHSKVFD